MTHALAPANEALMDLTLAIPAIAVTLTILAALELLHPARPAMRRRWPLNIGLGLLNQILMRLTTMVGPAALASWAQAHDFGLFRLAGLNGLPATILTMILMDLAVYWQHRASHRFNWLWALHKLHHGDPDFDISTSLRFHPGEALLSMLYKGLIGALLGATPEAMLLFELYLSLGSMIEHSNIALPPRLDSMIRRVWVTPPMHLIHHSAWRDDHNHNYSFALSLWDHLFGTYRASGNVTQIGLPKGDGLTKAP